MTVGAFFEAGSAGSLAKGRKLLSEALRTVREGSTAHHVGNALAT